MAKVWKDANEVIKMIHDLENEKLRQLDKQMTQKPKKWDNIDNKLNYNNNQNR